MKDYDVYFDCIFIGKQTPCHYKYRLMGNNEEEAIKSFERAIGNSTGLFSVESQKPENADKRYIINLNNVCCYKICDVVKVDDIK